MLKNEAKNNQDLVFVIFGITGDLASKKIIPSLWHLFKNNLLPKNFSIVGFGRRDFSDIQYKDLISEALKKYTDSALDEEKFKSFLELFLYQFGRFEDKESFKNLSSTIVGIEKRWGVCANKLFYLAVPPILYESIFNNLSNEGLNIPCNTEGSWSRILIEKPFGTDLPSAEKLDILLASHFNEDQIYRIDHYLFKEIIQSIENFRFSNDLFEARWGNSTIERIDIRLLERIGVEDRGSFYDAIGTLRDVGQNHLLAMLSAIAMERPNGSDAHSIQKNREEILNFLDCSVGDLNNKSIRAQHRGYKDIKGVAPDSDTETYFALKTELLHRKWKGVPIYMEAGKCMAESRKEIILTFKKINNFSNKIVFRLEPKDEIVIHFLTKKPGFKKETEERHFSFFLYEKETKVQYVEEYSKIIFASMNGDQSLFLSKGEIMSAWKFTDSIIKSWKENKMPLLQYEPNTNPHLFEQL